LPSVVLAPFTGAYHLDSIGYGRGPVETLSKGVPNESVWHSMVGTHASVDIPKQFYLVFGGNEPLNDSSRAPFIKLPIHKDE
jgi:hypothetical protein